MEDYGYDFLFFFNKEKEMKRWKTVYLAEKGKGWHGSLVSAFILYVYTAIERNGTSIMCQ